MFLKSWENKKGKRHSYIHLFNHEIVVGSDYGSGMTDNAGVCSLQKFLDGQFHSIIISDFGKETLKEVLSMIPHRKDED